MNTNTKKSMICQNCKKECKAQYWNNNKKVWECDVCSEYARGK